MNLKAGRDLNNLILHMRKPFQKDFPEVTQLEACEGHCFGLSTTGTREALYNRKKRKLKKKRAYGCLCVL